MMPAGAIAGAVLTGGRSRRMGGADKALLPLAGKPMIQHVIDRVQPQVHCLVLSVEQPSSAFEPFKLPQVADPLPGSCGPLVGLLSALQHIRRQYEWLLLVPCDAPFVPRDLAARLLEQASAGTRPGALVRCGTEDQPTFSLWNRSIIPRLEQAVLDEGVAGFKQFLQVVELARLDWPQQESAQHVTPFFNINDQQALEEARRLIQSTSGISRPCSM